MKLNSLLLALWASSFFAFSSAQAQAVNTGDSLALVDLYNSTNGPGWVNHTNWLTSAPLGTWFGVNVSNGRVVTVFEYQNNLIGTLPSTLGNLTQVIALDFHQNKLSGVVPGSLTSLVNLTGFNISDNQFNEQTTPILPILVNRSSLLVQKNQFTFTSIEYLFSQMSANNYNTIFCSQQADIPLHHTGQTYAVSAGGTLANNTYKWYKDNTLVATITGDSTYTTAIPGNYSVEVTNSVILFNPYYSTFTGEQFTLYSISTPDTQDSLALVDFYNSTNGPNWINHNNWLTSAPLSSWYGVTVRKGKVTMLDLSYNNLAGALPLSIGNLDRLTDLNLMSNQISGNIPATIANLSSLINLNLGFNKFTGNIPASIGSNTAIKAIRLGVNQLTGTIPLTLWNNNTTTRIELYRNKLSGIIPTELSKCQSLQSLLLHGNMLTGTIPVSLRELPELMELMLDDNELTGSIPDSLGYISNLKLLSVYNNKLTGPIPASLSRLSFLENLLLGRNQLTGPIPFLKNLTRLQNLDLQENKFNFDGMENLPVPLYGLLYTPQANIPFDINYHGGFTIAAGGTPSNNTYRFYKDGVLIATQVGDSVFKTNATGRYNITVSNSIATQLILLSDSMRSLGLSLANNNRTVTRNVSGTNFVNIEDYSAFPSVLLATVIPTAGANALSGNVTCSMIIDPTLSSYNGQPYVQRHYDITPSNNASSSAATVTLYFTQQDFNNFNNSPSHGIDLPKNPSDATGKANLRIYQYHGFSATSLPGSYAGPAVEIDPDDNRIFWNALANYWEVSFEVNGFSGFFISSQSNALLPIKLLSFTGKKQDKTAILKWATSSEINTSVFELQRNTDGNAFNNVATIPAAGNSSNELAYQYVDVLGNDPVYFYRLKMIDKDRHFTYSAVIKIANTNTSADFVVYPNPAREYVYMQVPPSLNTTTIKLLDFTGRVVLVKTVAAGITQANLSLQGLPQGAYKIVLNNGDKINYKTLVVQ